MLYALNQHFPSLEWQVVPVEEAQGRRMRERGQKHIYDTSRQAHAVKRRLNKKRKEDGA